MQGGSSNWSLYYYKLNNQIFNLMWINQTEQFYYCLTLEPIVASIIPNKNIFTISTKQIDSCNNHAIIVFSFV